MSSTALTEQLAQQIGCIPVIDTHEHLPDEPERLGWQVDFATLFSHYCTGDLRAAGDDVIDQILNPKVSVEEKWRLFAPIYDRIADGSYARCTHLGMQQFYGMDRLRSLQDAVELTARMREANQPGLYRRVLKDACGIVTSLNLYGRDREFFTPVTGSGWATEMAAVMGISAVERMERQVGCSITSLDRYVKALAELIAGNQRDGFKGLKFHSAYVRDLNFAAVSTAEAESVFNRAIECSQGWRPHALGYDEVRPLQDYLVHRMIEIAGDLDMTVVFHTGIQAGNYNRLDNARPGPLWNLFRRYHHVRFVLLHAALPWVEEAGIMAKYFRNVYVDLAWVHAISPELARRAVRTYVDLVPRNKVLGFGADCRIVEDVFGHLTLARQNLAAALADKIGQGALDEPRALAWAKALLHDNAIEAFKLDVKPLDA
jgi:predicted TIM-barrel fold metal-dependent hydrolase